MYVLLLFKAESTDGKFVLFKFTIKSLKIKSKLCKKEDSKFSTKEIRLKLKETQLLNSTLSM